MVNFGAKPAEMDIEQLLDLEQLEDEAIAERAATQSTISFAQQAAEEYHRTLEELNRLLSRQNARIAAGSHLNRDARTAAGDKEEASDAHKAARDKPEWDAGESGVGRQPRLTCMTQFCKRRSTAGNVTYEREKNNRPPDGIRPPCGCRQRNYRCGLHGANLACAPRVNVYI